jgi:hypothetical protein
MIQGRILLGVGGGGVPIGTGPHVLTGERERAPIEPKAECMWTGRPTRAPPNLIHKNGG